MGTKRKIFFLTLMVIAAFMTSVSILYLANMAGAYWSAFDTDERGNLELSSGYVVIDALSARYAGTEGIGPLLGDGPSFRDSDLVLYEGDADDQTASAAVGSEGKEWIEYKVSVGDTMSEIAESKGLSVADIMSVNGISNKDKLIEGNTLIIPTSKENIEAARAYVKKLVVEEEERKKQAKPIKLTNYIVKEGDTLWSIANAFDLDINSLFGCNKLSDANVLKVGAAIRVPNQDGLLYTLRTGQTVDQLAKEHGIYVEAILLANGLKPKESVPAGREIFLPGAKVTSNADAGGKKGSQAKAEAASNMAFRWPISGRISSKFAWRKDPIRRGRDFHTGLDIAAPHGRAIVASLGGKVVHAGWMGGYGQTIVISHSNGMTTLYGHCSKLTVQKGATVKKGDRIALVGSTGRSTGNHLHFEIRKNGSPLNPLKYLR